MSLKNIEMQIALPRTHDAGKIQEQLNQRGQLIHDQLAHTINKENDIKRSKVPENSSSAKLKLKKDNKNQQDHQQQEKNEKNEKQTENENHPYKGKTIDFFG